MDRRLVLGIAALALLALCTQILVWVFTPRAAQPAFSGPPRSDYTLRDFSIDALDDAGRHSFSISGPHLVRRAEDGSIFVNRPDYTLIDHDQSAWTGTSDSAWVNKTGTVMKLEGRVDMQRQPSATNGPARVSTSDLTIASTNPASAVAAAGGKTLQTAAPIAVTEPGKTMHAVGMHADLGLKTVEMLSQVHTILLPSRHAATP